ncbi:flagellar assembly protein FliH [Shewanella sp. OMA3-2]|uniref:flagellar assembly protein FliH n=1 Tax=Shewanella sp. OMA3-2 TaxID=2908650 RepID=UPI001F2A3DCA|nr:flagellar assembly protein FliH [Shewanella sp. OMA3-2]UJF21301.1 flagellar assembly protein FliH [Shewanella sp. OMA3-2]
MTDSKISKKVLNVEDEHEFSHWQLPDVTEDISAKPSNLYGKKEGAYQSSVAVVDNLVSMPTMAQIEEIRADAESEGFEQGKQDGLKQGLEQGRLDGLTQGHEEGFIQGEEQGYEAGMVKATQLIEQLSSLITQFQQPLAILDAEVESEVLAMTLSLAKAVVQQELKMHPEHIAATIRQGVDALPTKEQRVKLRLHPDDVALVMSLYGESQLTKNDWHLESDPSLSVGDVYIDSTRSNVDLRLSQRILQVFGSLDEQSTQLARQVELAKHKDSVYTTSQVDSELPPTADVSRTHDNHQSDNLSDESSTLSESDVTVSSIDDVPEVIPEIPTNAADSTQAVIDENKSDPKIAAPQTNTTSEKASLQSQTAPQSHSKPQSIEAADIAASEHAGAQTTEQGEVDERPPTSVTE